MKTILVTALVTMALTGCASIEPARMQLPPALNTNSTALAIEGLGAATRGSFRIGGASGEFTRGATRLSFFDVVTTDRGAATYSIGGGLFDSPVSARCGMKQRTITIDIVQFTPKKFIFECAFEGMPQTALVLGEAGDGVQTLSTPRKGELRGNGATISITSVHHVVGSPLPLAQPIGYLMEHAGQPVGAVELNGLTPQLRLRADAPPDVQRGATLAALAVGLLWDPALH